MPGSPKPGIAERFRRLSISLAYPFESFVPPKSRRQSLAPSIAGEAQKESDDKITNELIGRCVQWRKIFRAYKPPKESPSKRPCPKISPSSKLPLPKISQFKLPDMMKEREDLIREVNKHAVYVSRRQSHRLATAFVDQVAPHLLTDGPLSPMARNMVTMWKAPSGTIKEQVQKLKVIRGELGVVNVLEMYVNVNELNMLPEHQEIYDRGDELRYCTLVREHRERCGEDIQEYRIKELADRDAANFAGGLDWRWEHVEGIPKHLSAEDETKLMTAFRSQVRNRLDAENGQERLAKKGQYQNASMLLMIKTAVVEVAGQTLGLHGCAAAATAKIVDFMDRQNFVTAAEVRQAAQMELEHIHHSHHEDRSIWPDLP